MDRICQPIEALEEAGSLRGGCFENRPLPVAKSRKAEGVADFGVGQGIWEVLLVRKDEERRVS